MKKHDLMRNMLEEISDTHIAEAGDALSGSLELSDRNTGARHSWLWAGLAVAGMAVLLGAATVNLHKNAQQLQTGEQGTAGDDSANDAESVSQTVADEEKESVQTTDGENHHICTSDEFVNAQILRDGLNLEGQIGQIWYADEPYGWYSDGQYHYAGRYYGLQSEDGGVWYVYTAGNADEHALYDESGYLYEDERAFYTGGELCLYNDSAYLYFIKSGDERLHQMYVMISYKDGAASILVNFLDAGATSEWGAEGYNKTEKLLFRYSAVNEENAQYPCVTAQELYDFIEQIYVFADGADLVLDREMNVIVPAQEQPDLTDGFTKLHMVLPMVSEEYYNEYLSQYETIEEQLQHLVEDWYSAD